MKPFPSHEIGVRPGKSHQLAFLLVHSKLVHNHSAWTERLLRYKYGLQWRSAISYGTPKTVIWPMRVQTCAIGVMPSGRQTVPMRIAPGARTLLPFD